MQMPEIRQYINLARGCFTYFLRIKLRITARNWQAMKLICNKVEKQNPWLTIICIRFIKHEIDNFIKICELVLNRIKLYRENFEIKLRNCDKTCNTYEYSQLMWGILEGISWHSSTHTYVYMYMCDNLDYSMKTTKQPLLRTNTQNTHQLNHWLVINPHTN